MFFPLGSGHRHLALGSVLSHNVLVLLDNLLEKLAEALVVEALLEAAVVAWAEAHEAEVAEMVGQH